MATTTSPTTPLTNPFIPGWTSHPIPNFSLSAAGLLALADLSTLAQRTALQGGSSWLDSLLLVPGLHYQQAADELSRKEGNPELTAVEIGRDGKPTSHRIVNQAVVSYLLRVAREGQTVVLDVGEVPVKSRGWAGRGNGQRGDVLTGGGRDRRSRRRRSRSRSRGGSDGEAGLTGLASLLYLASPVLTCVAIAIVVLLRDYWALALLLGLMLSRMLNIYVIKSRSRPKPPRLPPPFPHLHTHSTTSTPPPRYTQYTVTLSPDTTIVLRGLSTDLYALTTTVWLRPRSHIEGHLEAAAKLLVYLVAAVSGNATQAGNIVLLALLLASAGLLALSNARTTGLKNGGKIVAPVGPDDPRRHGGGDSRRGRRREQRQHEGQGGRGCTEKERTRDRDGGRGQGGDGRHHDRRRELPDLEAGSWPSSSDTGSFTSADDSLEKGYAGRTVRIALPSDDSMEYEVQLDRRLDTMQPAAARIRRGNA